MRSRYRSVSLCGRGDQVAEVGLLCPACLSSSVSRMIRTPERVQQVAVASIIGSVAGMTLAGGRGEHRGKSRVLLGALAGAAGLACRRGGGEITPAAG